MSPIRLAGTWSSVSYWPGCVRWLRRRTLRSACCALGGSCGSGWGCRSPGCSGGWGWTAPTRGRRRRGNPSVRGSAARPSAGTASSPSGSGARTAGEAGSPAIQAAAGEHPGSVSYGSEVNTAAVLLAAYGNVPAERAANLIRMLLGIPVSPGFVDKASARLSDRLEDVGFDEAMQAALAAEPALGADETPVNVLTPDADPGTGQPETGSPHVLVIRPPGG